jgi:sec-independent protein translocase protein TatA
MSLAIFSGIGVWEILLLLLVVMLLFGSKRLPQMGRSMGRGLREFKDSVGDSGRELKQAIGDTPGEVKSAYDADAPAADEQQEVQQALPAQASTVEAPVATPVSDGQNVQATDPPGPTA